MRAASAQPASPERRRHSALFSYVVAGLFGGAFWLTLLVNAWYNTRHAVEQQFAYQTLALREDTLRRIRDTHDVVDNVSALFDAAGRVSEPVFERYTERLLSGRPYVIGMTYHAWPAAIAAAIPDGARLPATYVATLDPDATQLHAFDLAADADVRMAVETALDTGVVVPTPSGAAHAPVAGYVLLKAIRAPDAAAGAPPLGVLAATIDPQALVGARALQGDLEVRLTIETQGVGGRHVLFASAPRAASNGWRLTRLADESLVQFPHYSARLAVARVVRWRDVDGGLFLIAFVIGGGTTLLIVALAHAKETQERELRQRNEEIERQVRRQTRELAEARDQALAASRVKSDFLASMSHEIRTPLNAIIGMADLLSETRLDEDQGKYVSVFRKAGEALLSLVNDILDLSKIEAGQLVLEETDLDVTEVVANAADIYEHKCREKGITLAAEIDPAVPRRLLGDPTRLRQVILNLIGNAIKFTEQGGITVRVEPDPQQPAPGRLRIAVADTGIGIPADKREAIFQSFTQVDSSTTRKYGGTGLGLTISQKLVERMGGRIWVESEPGRGSTFYFTLACGVAPAAPEPRPTQAAEPEPGRPALTAGPGRILLVEDTPDNRMLIKAYLKREPYTVDEADNGETALARFKTGDYDLVLMDVQMPVMDGHEATRRIRAWEAEQGRAPVPIIALTAHAIREEVDKSAAAGCTAHLTKPIKKATLLDTIRRYLG